MEKIRASKFLKNKERFAERLKTEYESQETEA